MTAVLHPSLTERAIELRALAGYTHNRQVDADVAEGMAVRCWIAATLPDPAARWAEYVAAVGLLLDLEAGLVDWREVEPGLTGAGRHEVAVELARDQAAAALFVLLQGPEATPCQRCRRSDRDVWSAALRGGLCGSCADVMWIGGRA